MENKIEEKPIGLELKETSHELSKFFELYISKYMEWDLTTVEGMVMGLIFKHFKDNPDKVLTAKDLMGFYKIRKAATSKIVNGLEEKGVIKMIKAKSDSRFKEIVLTENGTTYCHKCVACWNEINTQIEKGLTNEEKQTLKSLLEKIKHNVNEGR